MKRGQLIGAFFTLAAGTLLHFVYDWSGENPVFGLFSPVNESTWEHLKLLAIPLLLFGVAEYFAYGRKIKNFVPVKLLSALLGMGTVTAVFYTYMGVVGRHFLWADIGTFVVGVAAAYLLSAHLLQTARFSSPLARGLGLAGVAALLVCFALFTFRPPPVGLFLDPVSLRYGAAGGVRAP